MSEAKRNGIASAEDFRKAIQASRFEEPVRVILPKCGLAVKLRRPEPAWMLFQGRLPKWFAARMAEEGGIKPEMADGLGALADSIRTVLQEVFIEPRLAVNPSPSEISPAWLDSEDIIFIIRWAARGVEADRAGFVGFRGERGDPDARAGGGDASSSLDFADGIDGIEGLAV
jgi:hypothetical protein